MEAPADRGIPSAHYNGHPSWTSLRISFRNKAPGPYLLNIGHAFHCLEEPLLLRLQDSFISRGRDVDYHFEINIRVTTELVEDCWVRNEELTEYGL